MILLGPSKFLIFTFRLEDYWRRPILGKNQGIFYKEVPENGECTINRGKTMPKTEENQRRGKVVTK
jgi:hypothetical protein